LSSIPTPTDAHGPGAILDIPPEGELGPQGDGPLTKGAVSWALFEGARNPYVILITIYVFMPYFARYVVGDPVKGQEAVASYGQYSGWIVMLTAPFLGSAIDKFGRRKGWLGLIVGLMVPLIASLWFATPGGHGLSVGAVIAIATIIGVLFTYTEVLHNSLLIRAAGMGGAHKASALGLSLGNGASVAALLFVAWAFALPGHVHWGWVPKAPLFGLNAATHEPDRVVALLSALVFAVGALPLFLFTPDAPRTNTPVLRALTEGARGLWENLKVISRKGNRDAAIFLASRMFYVDGMTAILLFAGVYATGVMKWGGLEMLFYGIILSVLAVAGGFIGGWMDATIGPKKSVQISIGMSILGVIAFLGMAPDKIFYFWHFTPALHAPIWNGPFFTTWPDIIYLLIGFSNAVFITAHYASSRTLLTRLTPPDQTATFFGVYALSGTATVWLGSFLVNLGTHVFKTQQGGFATILGLLAVGFVGLLFVKGGGRRTA
jgi:UMF1 family MFS transporter